MVSYLRVYLVAGFNPFEKLKSNWIISPNRGENEKYLKPPARYALIKPRPGCHSPPVDYQPKASLCKDCNLGGGLNPNFLCLKK